MRRLGRVQSRDARKQEPVILRRQGCACAAWLEQVGLCAYRRRERERIAFVSPGYWDLDVLTATHPPFTATLVVVDGARVATGKDFSSDGVAKQGVVVVSEALANTLADGLADSTFVVRSVEEKPYRSSPRAPFMTSTLQQEGGRKLRLGAAQVMRVAQGLCMSTAFTLTVAYLAEHFSPNQATGALAAYVTGNVASNFFGRINGGSYEILF